MDNLTFKRLCWIEELAHNAKTATNENELIEMLDSIELFAKNALNEIEILHIEVLKKES